MKGQHEFVVTTYLKPTYCDCCSRLLWGLSRQGLQCSVCEANIHKSCQNLILVSCHGPSDWKSLEKIEREAKQEFKDFKEPLNLLTTTPKNFTRFVSKIGPIVNGQEEILKILEWNEPGKSTAVLLGFILFCLYPWLLTLIPAFYIVLQVIQIKTRVKTDSQAQYMKNMQFIQNHMKMGSDLIDFLNEKHENLKDSKFASLILLYSILGSFIVSIGFYHVKINWVIMIFGVSFLLCHTVTFKYFSFLFRRMFSQSIEYYTCTRSKIYLKGEEEKTVKIFENQRWWAGLGWIPFLLKNERSAWSDESGTVAFSHIQDYTLPESFKWKEDEWHIYEDWSKEKGVDGQGWVYTDNSWQGPHPRITLGSYTRRRCWIRTMERLNGKVKQS